MTKRPNGQGDASIATVSCKTEQLLLAALERGGSCLETGRYLISYRDGQVEEGIKALQPLTSVLPTRAISASKRSAWTKPVTPRRWYFQSWA